MSAELLFLLISLTGAFAIGLGTAYGFGLQRRREMDNELRETNSRLDESLAELDRTRNSLNQLRDRLSDSVDLDDYKNLSERYADLEASNVDLEERLTLGLGRRRSKEESWISNTSLAEGLGLSILGEVPPEERDELTRVQGISPYLEERLNRIGIRTFEQLSRLEPGQVSMVNEAIEVLPGRIQREDWVGQCERLFAEVRRS